MTAEKIKKSNQEQAVAAWIDYLNQVRINELVDKLRSQDINFEQTMKILDETLSTVKETIIDRNRGGKKGMHGFIAEISECGIAKAREQIEGKHLHYEWINNNSPDDLVRAGVYIQQKFVNSGGHFSLNAVKEHLEKYPNYISEGKVYQIPKDYYDTIKELLEMPKEIADKLPTSTGQFSLQKWKEIYKFFAEGDIPFDSLEPSALSYDEVQAGAIHNTIVNEKEYLSEKNKSIRDKVYQESKPTFQQGIKAAVSGVIEGGAGFCIKVARKRKKGKKIKDFDKSDWQEISIDSGKDVIKGSVRGATIYTLSNYTATPAAVANAIVTASFGVAEQSYLLRAEKISEVEFIENSEMLCLDAAVSALSSLLGQVTIPIPILGAVIGNTVGTVMYQIGKDKFSEYEGHILQEYAESLRQLDDDLAKQYRGYIDRLNEGIVLYMGMLEIAFAADVSTAFHGSVALASYLGVATEEILDTPEKTASFFND